MLGGKMPTCSQAGGMAMGGKTCNYHLEVHIYKRRGGAVVTHARVAVRLVNQRTHASIALPIMTMVGANQGMRDLHYGNNVYAAKGSYRVIVQVNGAGASFGVRLG